MCTKSERGERERLNTHTCSHLLQSDGSLNIRGAADPLLPRVKPFTRMCRESRGTGATAALTELHRAWCVCVLYAVDCEDHHLRTHTVSLHLLDVTGNAALEQWKHVAWLLRAERRLSCRIIVWISYIICLRAFCDDQTKLYYSISIWLCFSAALQPQVSNLSSQHLVICYILHNFSCFMNPCVLSILDQHPWCTSWKCPSYFTHSGPNSQKDCETLNLRK